MAIEDILVIQDLAIVVVVALAMALVFRWLRQPLLIGYIVAGIIIGPYTPPFSLIHYPDILEALAEIGIVFLLFAVGLEYPLARLRAVGRKAIVIALSESLATFAAGFLVGQAFGFTFYDSLFVGLAISVTSTVILSSVLEDIGVLRSPDASLVLGITVVEDIVTVTLLGILQSTAQNGHLSPVSIAISLLLVVVFIAGVLVVGPRTISPLIDRVREAEAGEILLLAILGVAFGLAIVSSLIGISVATGAFLAGVLVAESKSQARAHELMAPLKELFGAIFFVSMGALMDVGLLTAYLLPILAFLATAFGVKFASTYLAARRERLSAAEAQRTALTLSASGGELSIVVAKGGADIGATSTFVLPFIGALTIVTTLIAPFLMRYAWRTSNSRPPEPESVTPAAPGGAPSE
jgi:monovalent cation:H+ antiporter-2, CPA2 family